MLLIALFFEFFTILHAARVGHGKSAAKNLVKTQKYDSMKLIAKTKDQDDYDHHEEETKFDNSENNDPNFGSSIHSSMCEELKNDILHHHATPAIKRFGAASLLECHLQELYNKNVRPEEHMSVLIDFYPIRLLNFDEISETMEMSSWLRLEWTDPRLVWEPAEFLGIEEFRIPAISDYIWLPDTTIYNSVTESARIDVNLQPDLTVSHTGKVRWVPNINTKTECQLDLRHFPFDVQMCYIKIGSWVYSQDELDFVPFGQKSGAINKTNEAEYFKNSLWYLERTLLRKSCREYATSSLHSNRCDIKYFLIFKRNPNYFLMNIVIPTLIFGSLCCFVFYLPADSGERLSLALSVLITVSVFQIIVMEFIPKSTEHTPIITTFMTVLMSVIFISIVFTTFILRLYMGYYDDYPGNLAHKLCFRILGPRLYLNDKKLIEEICRIQLELNKGIRKLFENTTTMARLGNSPHLKRNISNLSKEVDARESERTKLTDLKLAEKVTYLDLQDTEKMDWSQITSLVKSIKKTNSQYTRKQLIQNKISHAELNKIKSYMSISQKKHSMEASYSTYADNEAADEFFTHSDSISGSVDCEQDFFMHNSKPADQRVEEKELMDLEKKLIELEWKYIAMCCDRICMLVVLILCIMSSFWFFRFSQHSDHQIEDYVYSVTQERYFEENENHEHSH